MNIILTIGGKQADLPVDFDILFNYTLEDTTNPSSVKNSFTKSCNLPGTENNDRLFNLFFRNDRMGAGRFDPGKRVPFELFINGNLEESGYVQLNKVSISGGNRVFCCTLYGGVGDFFYGLDANEDGSRKTLADLDWKIDGATSPETEMDFRISKDVIKAAWDRLRLETTGSTLFDTINFIPLNEGVIGDFDSDKVLINTEGQTVFPASSGSYTTVDGYALGSLNKKYDWLAMRDIRSYMQRPAVKISRFFEAVCDPDNNGGYEVVLDDDFFKEDNPFFQTWMTLPSLSTSNNTEEEKNSDAEFQGISTSDPEDARFGLDLSGSTPVIVSGDISSDSSGVIDISDEVFGYMDVGINIGVDVSGSTWTVSNFDRLYPYVKSGGRDAHYFFVQVVAYDADSDQVIGGSDIYCFNGGIPSLRRLKGGLPTVARTVEYTPAYDANYIDVQGSFLYNPERGVYEFTDDVYGAHIWQATVKNLPKSVDNVKFVTTFFHGYIHYDWGFLGLISNFWVNKDSRGSYNRMGDNRIGNDGTMLDVMLTPYSNSGFIYSIPNTISTGAKVSKRTLLTTGPSVLDFLLSYTKTFGLYWEKDRVEKKVYCRTRNNFFTGEIVDIDKRIDRSGVIDIQPNVFENRFYDMVYETPETQYAKNYSDYWGRTYGNQRIDVGTEWNNELTEMYEDNSFTSLITARDASRYYRDYYDSGSRHLPVFIYDGVEYELYRNGAVDDTTSSTITSNIIDYSKTVDWYGRAGYDYMPRPVGYIMDGGEKKNVDSRYTLLFFNGFKTGFNVDYEPIEFWITDDLPDMITLNDGRCWLYTTQATCNGETIAIKMGDLPYFSRYTRTDRYPILSLDFGTPAEVFEDTLTLGDNSNIYQRYWKAYMEDQFDADARKVTCNVLLDMSLMTDPLRKFYFFDGSLWVLNRIIDYSPIKYRTTKCEFIRVIDPSNYTDGQIYVTPGEGGDPTGSTSTVQDLVDAGYITKEDVIWRYAGSGTLYTFKASFPYASLSPESVTDLITLFTDDDHNQFRFESRTDRRWGNYIASLINNNTLHHLPIYKVKNVNTNQNIVMTCDFAYGVYGMDYLVYPVRENYDTQDNWYNSTDRRVTIDINGGDNFVMVSFKYLNTITGVTITDFVNPQLALGYGGCFQDAQSLQDVSIPYYEAGEHMFDGCSNLRTVSFHRTGGTVSEYNTLRVPYDCPYLFNGCTSLTRIEPVVDVTDLDLGGPGQDHTFTGLRNLTEIRLKGVHAGDTKYIDLVSESSLCMPNLDEASIKYLVDNLVQNTGEYATLAVSEDEYAALGGAEGEYVERARDKGWNVVVAEY